MKIEDLVKAAKENNMQELALTDNCNLFGAMEFSQTAVNNGIKPIIGSSLKFSLDIDDKFNTREFNITFLVKNKIGWQNLCSLVTKAFFNFKKYSKKIVDINELKNNSEGLIVLFNDLTNDISNHEQPNILSINITKKLKNIYQDRLYIDIFRESKKNISNKEIILSNVAYNLNIPMVCTNDVAFLGRNMHEAQDCLLCIKNGTTILDSKRERENTEKFFKSSEEMLDVFQDREEIILNTLNLAKRCSFILENCKPKLPNITSDPNISEEEILRTQAKQGLIKRINHCAINEAEKDSYNSRLEYEIKVICSMGYAGYFLIVSDFIIWAKNRKIPVGPGRGSGAGSIVAWSLFITDLDPIKYGLLFERFLNPDRVSLPDFDIDFCIHKREDVIDYVRSKYGKEKVAQIITFNTLKARAVIRDIGRVLGMNYGRVDKIAKLIPNTPGIQKDLKSVLKTDKNLEALVSQDDELEKLFRISKKLEGVNRNASTHAAGLVISNSNIKGTVALYYDQKSDIPATQFSMKYIEKIGLIKFDFLGVETLSVLDETTKLIKNRNVNIDLEKISLSQKETFETLSEGNTLGVFQLESLPMKQILRQLKPDRIEDIIAVVALYRPGPMENIPAYIARKHNNKLTQYPHPLLKEILSETYGIMIYQEQVMEAARIVAGFSLSKADLLRRAMGKKIKSEMMDLKDSFISGSIKNGIQKKDADKIFNDIEKFAGYGFNKSHAAAYAIISYQTAWCKTNYPAEFYTALLNSEIGSSPEKMSGIKSEIERSKISVLKSDINLSNIYFSVEKDGDKMSIRSGLANIKNVGVDLATKISDERIKSGRYLSLIDFFKRINSNNLNKRQIEYLSMAGVFDSLHSNRAEIFNSASNLIKISQLISKESRSNQKMLFDENKGDEEYKHLMASCNRWADNSHYLNEYRALGFFISGHPLKIEMEFFKNFKLSNSFELQNNRVNGKTFELLGFLVKYEEKSLGNIKFLDLYFIDSKGAFDIRVFKEAVNDFNVIIKEGKSYIMSVVHSLDRDSRMRIKLTTLRESELFIAKSVRRYKIYLDSIEHIEDLRYLLSNTKKGDTDIIIVCNNKEIQSGLRIKHDDKIFDQIQKVKGIENIEKLI